MGEAKRRQATDAVVHSAEQVIAGIWYIEHEGSRVWSIDVIYPGDLAEMTVQAINGNAKVDYWLDTITAALLRLQPESACLLCERTVAGRTIGAFVLVTAEVDEPSGALVNFICNHCALHTATLPLRVHQHYNGHLFGGNMRILPPL